MELFLMSIFFPRVIKKVTATLLQNLPGTVL